MEEPDLQKKVLYIQLLKGMSKEQGTDIGARALLWAFESLERDLIKESPYACANCALLHLGVLPTQDSSSLKLQEGTPVGRLGHALRELWIQFEKGYGYPLNTLSVEKLKDGRLKIHLETNSLECTSVVDPVTG